MQIQADETLVGAESTTKRSPDDWPNRSVSWTVEVGDLGSQVTVWEDGSSEIDLIDMVAGDAYSEHRQVDDIDGIQVVVEVARAWVVGRRLPAAE